VDIDGRGALVTGGASGLGNATARRLIAAGARVVLVDVAEDALKEQRDELGSEVVAIHAADVRDPDAVAAAVGTAVERFGGLHIAVNCAGILPSQRVLSRNGPHGLDLFSRVVEINLIGTFNVIRLGAEAMATNDPDGAGERGVIVNTASIAAFDGQVGQAAYAASKGGVVGMTLPIARDLARHGIRNVTIAPGVFGSPMVQALPQESIDALEAGIPFPHRLGDPDEFGLFVTQIVTNPYLNGETIRLDAGLRMS
jgi:NAD(P)-dependent dehydrogenase (short-subunit alcohol dehydrogenase family)